MNQVILCGRLTKNPTVSYSQDMCIAKYTLAIDRMKKGSGTDFINCVAFGKTGEFAEKYLRQGMKMLVHGRMQTGSYKDKEGRTIYTTDVVVDEHEFVEKKEESTPKADNDGFMKIPEDEGLPFN